jgi:hypothetical protein
MPKAHISYKNFFLRSLIEKKSTLLAHMGSYLKEIAIAFL